MALDQNLFTLQLNRLPGEDGSIDLVDPAGALHYRKRRLDGAHLFGVYEPLSDSLLAAIGSSSNNKAKVIELFNPNAIIQIKYVGTLSFRWSFQWEDHTFEWKREQCFLIRKPDPPVLVAITKEPPGKIRSTVVQILDYNLMRFDIMDRKGLEIVMLTALLSFQDEDGPSPKPSSSPPPPPSKVAQVPEQPTAERPAPKIPERSPDDEVAILQASESHEANEVVVGEVGEASKYADLCIKLLKDSSIVFISIRSSSSTAVPKVVKVADLTKRMAHRDDAFTEELHQYLTYREGESTEVKKKKKVIKLDDGENEDKRIKQEVYKPPENLVIRISKIPMPELMPKPKRPDPPSPVIAAPPPSSVSSLFGKLALRKKDESKATPAPASGPSTPLAPAVLPQRPVSATPALGAKAKLSKPPKNGTKIQTPPVHSRVSSSHSLPPQSQHHGGPPMQHNIVRHNSPSHAQQNWPSHPAPQGHRPTPSQTQPPDQLPQQQQPQSLASLFGTAAYHMFTSNSRR